MLEFLAQRVRLLSMEQVGRLLDPLAEDPQQVARHRLARLERARLVQSYQVVGRRPARFQILASYSPGGEVPGFQVLSKTLRARASAMPPEATLVVRLGLDGSRLMGAPIPRLARRGEVSHELQLAEAAISIHQDQKVERWIHEAELLRSHRFHGVVPDAEVWLKGGTKMVVECGGTYSAKRLAGFHARIAPQLEPKGFHGYCIV